MPNQVSLFATEITAATATAAPGARVTFRGVEGTILDSAEMVEVVYRIALDDGRIATLKRAEFALVFGHVSALMWSACPCVGCVEMRKTAGRMWAS